MAEGHPDLLVSTAVSTDYRAYSSAVRMEHTRAHMGGAAGAIIVVADRLRIAPDQVPYQEVRAAAAWVGAIASTSARPAAPAYICSFGLEQRYRDAVRIGEHGPVAYARDGRRGHHDGRPRRGCSAQGVLEVVDREVGVERAHGSRLGLGQHAAARAAIPC